MIKNATFSSVWDGGYEITTNCKVNTETGKVFDIETAEADDSLDVLESEFITIDGIDYAVSNDDMGDYYFIAEKGGKNA